MVQLLCGLGLVGGPGGGELGGAEVAVGGVGSVHVIVDPPVGDDDAGFEEVVPSAAVQQLVAQAVVEALDPGVLPWRAGVDERCRSR